jgi:hypothetical protein
VNDPEKALIQRVKELRRRHFGARGKAAFAAQLGLPPADYERFEKSQVPPGEVMVRMCEVTGEDLQWLLTGISGRGTVVISGTRRRHQDLLARLAQLLDAQPGLATPVEAFVDLLASGETARRDIERQLPAPVRAHLIPVMTCDQTPKVLPTDPDDRPGGGQIVRFEQPDLDCARETWQVRDPAVEYQAHASRSATLLRITGADSSDRCILSADIAACFSRAFGVEIPDDTMQPMFRAGDLAIVDAGLEPKIGQPTLCRTASDGIARCRIWLGHTGTHISLGRLGDGATEQVDPADVDWALNVILRLSAAA